MEPLFLEQSLCFKLAGLRNHEEEEGDMLAAASLRVLGEQTVKNKAAEHCQ